MNEWEATDSGSQGLMVCVSFTHHEDEIVLSHRCSFPPLVVQGATMLSIKYPFQPSPCQYIPDPPIHHVLFDLLIQTETETGFLSRPKLSLYPAHLTCYWSSFELGLVLLTLDCGSDISFWPLFHLGNPSGSSPGLEARVLLCSVCLPAPSPPRNKITGPHRGPCTSQHLPVSALCSFSAPLASLMVLMLQPLFPGPSYSSFSACLSLNVDFGLWVGSHVPPPCLASSQNPGQGQIPGDPLQGKEVEHTQSSFAFSLCLNFHVAPDEHTPTLDPTPQNFADSPVPMVG